MLKDPSDRMDPSEPIRVLIADDDIIFRRGLRTLLKQPGISISGEACTGLEAVQLNNEIHPDVVLLDVRMPDMDGLHALKAIKATRPHTAVIIVTSFESKEFLWQAVLGGAADYLLKANPMDTKRLVSVIRRVAEGETSLSLDFFQEKIQELDKLSARFTPSYERWDPPLTQKEVEVLRLMARRMPNSEIAIKLNVEMSTLKSHINHLFRKILASDRTQAVLWAAQHGLLAEKRSGESEDALLSEE